MDRTTLKQRLWEAESLLHREELNILRQREAVGMLERAGHDASLARAFLKRLESRLASDVADRDRLFKQLADQH
jgi:hypothetical protein